MRDWMYPARGGAPREGSARHVNKGTRGQQPVSHATREVARFARSRECSDAVRVCTLYTSTGPWSEGGSSIPTVKQKLYVWAQGALRNSTTEGGGVPRVTGSHNNSIRCSRKTDVGALLGARMGSKRQIDLYLSNDQTRRHPQRKFRDSRVKTNCI